MAAKTPLRLFLHWHDIHDLTDVPVWSADQAPKAYDPALFQLVEQARRAGPRTDFEIIISKAAPYAEKAKAYVTGFLQYRQETARSEIRIIYKQAFYSIIKGLLFMVLWLSISFVFSQYTFLPPYWQFLGEESSYIFAWVGMWKPVELLLYERWPFHYQEKVLRKLLAAPIITT
jgi:hypothetical protein